MKPPANNTPTWVKAAAAIGVGLIALPLIGLLQRTPWSDFFSLLRSDTVTDALRVSLLVSLIATAISIAVGIPIAYTLAKTDFRAKPIVRGIVMLPMVLPPVVGGTALLFALGRRGLVGQWLDRWFDFQLPFTTTGAVVAATFVALPFFVVAVESALTQAGNDLDEAAATLGASPTKTLWRVTLPNIRSAIVAGAALSWARALGEFGATVTFAGNLPGETQTLPLATFVALESNPEEALVLSVILLTVAFAVLASLRGRLVST